MLELDKSKHDGELGEDEAIAMVEPHGSKSKKRDEDESVDGPPGNNQSGWSTEESKCCIKWGPVITPANGEKGGQFLFMEEQNQSLAKEINLVTHPINPAEAICNQQGQLHYKNDYVGNDNVASQGGEMCNNPKPITGQSVELKEIGLQVDSPPKISSSKLDHSTMECYVPHTFELPNLKGMVSPILHQPSLPHATSVSGKRCLSFNIDGATRGPLRRPTSFSLGSTSAAHVHIKRTSFLAKDQIQIGNSLSDECIRNRNRIILQKHNNMEVSQILEIGKNLGLTINELETVTILRLVQLQSRDQREIHEAGQVNQIGVEDRAL
ncbi:hypothetical protein VNO78_25622 [Psophocarpus tetragonolobus]|uniref:Uncharacterized protein n=1 Tax=Psophocarpus tetragonolobus TaxID=3891 RepID=A0AAN9S673_PSOTE